MLFGHEYWSRLIDFDFLSDSGLVADEQHLDLFRITDSVEDAREMIKTFTLTFLRRDQRRPSVFR